MHRYCEMSKIGLPAKTKLTRTLYLQVQKLKLPHDKFTFLVDLHYCDLWTIIVNSKNDKLLQENEKQIKFIKDKR